MKIGPGTLFLRLLLLTLPVEAVILVLFGVWLVRGIERREATAFDQRLRIQSREVLGRGALDSEGKVRFEMGHLAVGPGTWACVLDGVGKVLWEIPEGWFEASGLRATSSVDIEYVRSISFRDARYRVLGAARRVKKANDPGAATGPLVAVVLAEPLTGLEKSNAEFRQKSAVAGVALMALTGALLWVGIGIGLRPVWAMIRRLGDVPGPSGAERLDEGRVLRELRPLAAEINRLLDRLWAMVEGEKRFTAEAAHELRTPLTLMKSTLQTALLTSKSSEDYAKALHEALEDLQRLETTAEELLALSRADAFLSDCAPVFEDIPVPGLLRAMAERFASAAEDRALAIALELQPTVIRGERAALERLFGNLLDNAIKYSRPGGTVTLRCTAGEGRVLVAVEDDGPAVPESDRPHLFEQFFRGASGRAARVRGAGLGLTIAAAIARLHSADLTYEPRGQEVNRFVIRFPLPEAGGEKA